MAAAMLLQSRDAISVAAFSMIDCTTSSASTPSSSSPCADVPCELFSHAVSFSEAVAESRGFLLLSFFFGRSSSGRSSSRTRHAFVSVSIPDKFFSCLRWTIISQSSRKNVNSPAARKRYSGGMASRASAVTLGLALAGAGCLPWPSKSKSLSSLELSSSANVSAWVMTSDRRTRRESVSLHMTKPGCRLASRVLVSNLYTLMPRSEVLALARLARLAMVSGMDALLNTSPNPSTVTDSFPEKQSFVSCTTVPVSTPRLLDSHSW